MSQLPHKGDTPFSLPYDRPQAMPIDYPAFESNGDEHEAYDEGRDDIVDANPYRLDDDPIKSSRQLSRAGIAGQRYYTTNHEVIRRWVSYRYGHPARQQNTAEGFDAGGLCIVFEDDEPDQAVDAISWQKFFYLFEKNNLAFVYRIKDRTGEQSQTYEFYNRHNVGRVTEAKIVP